MSRVPFVLFVGDTTEDLCFAAQQQDQQAYQINDTNVDTQHNGTAFVSLGDLQSVGDFFNLLTIATKIVYSPPAVWSDKKTSKQKYSIAWTTEHYIRLVSVLYQIPTENVPAKITGVSEPLDRKTQDQQLWVAGCSTTFGIGVDKDQRYQDIVKNSLGIPATDLSQPGTSIAWSRDQILKSDIRENDIVVWGITAMDRFCWFNDANITHVGTGYYASNPEFNKTVPVSMVDAPHRVYEALTAIQQVDNFCNKVGAHLILPNIHGNLDIQADCAKYKGFVMIHGSKGLEFDSSFLDLGSDGRHPGPKTHRYYADLVLKKIKELNIGIQK